MRRITTTGFLIVLLAVLGPALSCAPAGAVEPDEVLADPAIEARARKLSLDLRCLVCQNQSIDDSNAPLARDLRVLVRERLMAGDSDAEVRSFVVARYGEFVLLTPPLGWHTLLLWLTPVLVLGAAGGVVWRSRRRPGASPALAAGRGETALSADEQARLAVLLRPDGIDPKT